MHHNASSVLFITVLMLCITYTSGYAQTLSGTPPPATKYHDAPVEGVSTLMGKKLFQVITNIETGWGEIPHQLSLSTKSEEAALGIPLGLVKGIIMTAGRTVTGTVETALFLAPAPGYYDPILSPALLGQKAEDPRALARVRSGGGRGGNSVMAPPQ